jgi:PAS domain S-box-containing protein
MTFKDRSQRGKKGLSQTYLATIEASSMDPIIGMTTKGTVVSWNPAAEKLFGYTAHEMKGRLISELVPPDHSRQFKEILRRMGSGERVRQFETVCTQKDGDHIPVAMNVSPLVERDSGVTGGVAIVRDFTRRVRGREILIKRNRELLTFHRLSQIVLSPRSLYESYEEIVKEICSATGFPIAAIAILDDTRQTVAFHGLQLRRLRSSQIVLELPIEKTLSGFVVRTGKPIIEAHISEHPEYRSRVLRNTRAQTFVGFPMKVGQKIIGCLNLAHTESVDISKETAQWIEALANYVAMLTERKRAEEELRNSQEQLRELSRWTQSAIEEERKRIAREIHDVLGQELSLLQLELELVQDRLPKGEKDLQDQVKSMTGLIDSSIRSVQKISTDLRPTLLDNLGLGAAVEWAVKHFQKRAKIRCYVSVDPPDLKLDPERSTALFRILQEALTNIVRHARASRVKVRLEKQENAVMLKVHDNGKGIPLNRITDSKSVGLTGMRERVHPWSGSVVISGKPGKGTGVVVTIPLSP